MAADTVFELFQDPLVAVTEYPVTLKRAVLVALVHLTVTAWLATVALIDLAFGTAALIVRAWLGEAPKSMAPTSKATSGTLYFVRIRLSNEGYVSHKT